MLEENYRYTKKGLLLLVISLFALFFATTMCVADEMNWEGAWQVLLENSPSLKAARHAITAAEASLKLTGSNKRITSSITVTETLQEGVSDSTVGGLTLSYSANLAGREDLAIASARLAYDEALLSYKIAKIRLFQNASFAYWSAAAADAALKAAEEEIRKREAFLEDAKLRYNQGLVPQLDVLRAESALAEARASYAYKKSVRGGFYAMLKGLAGWTDIEPQKDIFEKVEIPVRKDAPDYFSVIENHPAIVLQNLEVSRNKALVKLARTGMAPQISISGTRNLFKEGASTSYAEDKWSAQATLLIPIGDGGKTKWSIKQAQAYLDIAESELGKEKATVMEELFSFWEEYKSAFENYISSKKRLELVSKERDISILRYNEGLSSQLDVLDAQSRYADSLANYIEAKKSVLVSYARLIAAEGYLP